MFDFIQESGRMKPPPNFESSPIYRDWKEAVGEAIADNTVELRSEGATLHVAVNSSTWAHELINQQNSVLRHLQERGYRELTEMSIRIRVSNPIRRPTLKKPPPTRRTTTPELRELFEQLASESQNPEMRAAFLRMSGKSDED